MNKIILFDIDRTIFDTSGFGEKFVNELANRLSIDRESVLEVKRIYKSTLAKESDYLPEEFLKLLADTYKHEFSDLYKIYSMDEKIFENSLFNDVFDTLERLRLEEFRIGIFSEGFEEFQTKKISHPTLKKYLDNDLIFIARKKLSLDHLEIIPAQSIIVDDKVEVVEEIFEYGKHTPILINRNEKKSHPKIRTIYSLNEI